MAGAELLSPSVFMYAWDTPPRAGCKNETPSAPQPGAGRRRESSPGLLAALPQQSWPLYLRFLSRPGGATPACCPGLCSLARVRAAVGRGSELRPPCVARPASVHRLGSEPVSGPAGASLSAPIPCSAARPCCPTTWTPPCGMKMATRRQTWRSTRDTRTAPSTCGRWPGP